MKSSEFQTILDCSNPVHIEVVTNNHAVEMALSDEFTFNVPGAQFQPRYKKGKWDGKIRMFDRRSKKIYTGLVKDIYDKLKSEDFGEVYIHNFNGPENLRSDFMEWFEKQTFPFEPDEYQIEAAIQMICGKRRLIESPTNSGKTFIIYLYVAYCLHARIFDNNILVVVPSIMLLNQTYEDLIEFGIDEEDIHKLRGSKDNSAKITITTWQSIFKLEPEWFQCFDSVVVDEVHLAESASIRGIMEKCQNAHHRNGLSGSLRDSKTAELVLRGLFGPIIKTTTTKELIDRGRSAKLKVISSRFGYDRIRADRPDLFENRLEYMDEIKFLLAIKARDRAIFDIIQNRDKDENVLILFRFKKHGKRLVDLYRKLYPDEEVYVIHGGIKGADREFAKKRANEGKGVKLFATYATLSTGVSIDNLNVGVLASPVKSKITVIQTVGRYLRVSEDKDSVDIYDIFDDLELGPNNQSYCANHAEERMLRYIEQEFDIEEEYYDV